MLDAFQHFPEAYLENLIELLGIRSLGTTAAERVTDVIYVLAKEHAHLATQLVSLLRRRLERLAYLLFSYVECVF